jgi:hypothetical protein
MVGDVEVSWSFTSVTNAGRVPMESGQRAIPLIAFFSSSLREHREVGRAAIRGAPVAKFHQSGGSRPGMFQFCTGTRIVVDLSRLPLFTVLSISRDVRGHDPLTRCTWRKCTQTTDPLARSDVRIERTCTSLLYPARSSP